MDRLLTLVYYHTVPAQPSLTALVDAGSADTYLDQLTSGGEMLTFAANGSQVCEASVLTLTLTPT